MLVYFFHDHSNTSIVKKNIYLSTNHGTNYFILKYSIYLNLLKYNMKHTKFNDINMTTQTCIYHDHFSLT